MDARRITLRDVISGVRHRWMHQYRHYRDDYKVLWGPQRTAGEIRRDLVALDLDVAVPTDVDRAIGVGGWAVLKCELCRSDVESLIRIGEEPGYEARWVDVCDECLRTVVRTVGLTPLRDE